MLRWALLISLAGLTVSAPPTRAGVYSPDEPTPFTVRPDGTAEELRFGTQTAGPFRQMFVRFLNVADPNPARRNNPERHEVLVRVIVRRALGAIATPPDAATVAADLIRVRKADEAVNVLAPLSRGRSPDFRVLANLAHAHAVRGEWEEAVRWHELAAFDVGVPDDLAGTTPEQRRWLQKVERQYYTRWLRVHRQRAAERTPPEREDVFPLFESVRFVNDAGRYEPGKLAAAERAKLPPDAVAVVQQLLLWSPEWDTGLYWLLGELYAADGRVREARVIFDQVAEARQYSNRPVFMAHRAAVREAEARLPPERPEEVVVAEPPGPPELEKPAGGGNFLPPRNKVIAVGAVFAVIVLALLVLQLRAISRRRGPSR